MGAAVLYWRNEIGFDSETGRFKGWDTFGGIFVNSGITPIVLATWALVLGSSVFRRQNMIKAASAGICFSTGYVLLHVSGEVDLWDYSHLVPILGPALFEMGVVFFISKVFFMTEDAELQVERLEAELAEAKKSPGMGLALSYFYNFLLPTASNWKGIGTEISIQNEVYKVSSGPFIYVFIPRTLTGVDMKAQLREMQDAGVTFQGKPLELKEASHRPMFLFLLQRDSNAKTAGYCFDVPTVISSCYDRANSVQGDTEEREKAMANVMREIVDFENNLQLLVNNHEKTRDSVVLVSIPPPPFDSRELIHIASKVSSRE